MILAAALLATSILVSPPPGPVLLGGATTSSDREWSVARPNRGTSRAATIVRLSSTVPPRWRAFARCVLDRESGGTLERPQSGVGALNTEDSGAAGRWQFMANWRHGLPYMVKDRLEQFGMSHREARKVRIYLSRLHYIHTWPGVYQDIGFNEVVERGGAFHWFLRGSRCDGLAAM